MLFVLCSCVVCFGLFIEYFFFSFNNELHTVSAGTIIPTIYTNITTWFLVNWTDYHASTSLSWDIHVHPNPNIKIHKNDSQIPPSTPSLVVIGPEKSGTTSLTMGMMNKFQEVYRSRHEIYYWVAMTETSGTVVCTPKWNIKQWKHFIFTKLKHISQLSTIAEASIHKKSKHQLQSDRTSCTIQGFGSHWEKIFTNTSETKCIHPSYPSSVDTSNMNLKDGNNLPYCWFIEKSPNLSRNPTIGTIFSNYLPKVKLLQIVRNPITLIWSWIYAFHSKQLYYRYNNDTMLYTKYLLNYYQQSTILQTMRQECVNINLQFEMVLAQAGIQTSINTATTASRDDDDHITMGDGLQTFVHVTPGQAQEIDNKMEKYYLDFIKAYLHQKFVYTATHDVQLVADVNDDINISKKTKKKKNVKHAPRLFRPSVEVLESLIWVSLMYPTFLFYVLSYDGTFGFENWDQFRLIQFEYVFSDLDVALDNVKCWLQSTNLAFEDNALKSDNVNTGDKHMARSQGSMDVKSQYFFKQMLNPCYKALDHTLLYRSELLLGKWIPWD